MITLAQRPDLMRRLAARPETFDVSCAHTMVYAPCCGRKTPADTVVSLEGLKTEIRGGNHLPKRDHDWACDGCLHLLIHDEENGWTWSNLFATLGAPDVAIRHYLALEVLGEAEREAGKKREWIKPGEIYEAAYEHLPADLKTDRATMRPDV